MKFLEKLAIHILENWQDDLKNLVVVLPNNRAKLFLTKYLMAQQTQSMWMPQMLSSRELFEKISGAMMADDYLLGPMLYASIPEPLQAENSYDEFLNWGLSLLQDFKEMDHQLADPKALFENLVDIKRMEQWNPSMDDQSDQQKKYLKFCTLLPNIYQAFNQEMTTAGIGHSGIIQRKAARNVENFAQNYKDHYLIAGFNALTKAENKIFKSLIELSGGEMLFDYDAYYVDDPLQEAGLFARENIQTWSKNPLNWTDFHFKDIPKKIDIYKCSNSIEQAYALSEILKDIQYDQPDDTAIVLADESMLIPVLKNLPAAIKKVNVTMGYPLKYSSFYGFFDALIKLHFSLSSKGKDKGNVFYYKDVLRFLNNESLRHLLNESSIDLVDALLKEVLSKNMIYISGNRLNDALFEVFGSKGLLFNALSSPVEILNLLNAIIQLLEEQLAGQDHFEVKVDREFLLHHLEINNQLISIVEQIKGEISLISLHKMWRHYHQITKVQFTGEPLSGLQIMGLLETRNLDFKEVILLNANEGVLPSARSYGSMIPFDIKKHFGLLVHHEREAVFAYHFYRLLQRCEKAHLLYHTKSGDFGGGEISRFLIQLKKELPTYNDQHRVEEILVSPTNTYQETTTKEIVKTAFIQTAILDKFKRGLSPTAISTFVECPLDFYYKYVVGLSEEEEVSESIEAKEFGNIVHETLEKLYAPFLNEVLTEKHLEGMRLQYPQVLDAILKKTFDQNYLNVGKNILGKSVAGKYIERFLELELERIKGNTIKVLGLEQKLSRTLSLDLKGNKEEIKIVGKIDRIESINGQINIIDYKTGLVTDYELRSKTIEEGFGSGKNKMMQLLIYAWMAQQNEYKSDIPSSAKVYSMRRYEKGFVDLEIDGDPMISLKGLEEIETQISSIALEFLLSEDSLTHSDTAKYCNYCQ